MDYGIERTFRQGLREFGHKFTIHYRASAACTDCGTADPFYGGTTDYVCSTCNGSGIVWTSTAKYANGIFNQFSKGFKYVEDNTFKHAVHPTGVSRGTFWLNDVLVSKHSVAGATYFDNCATVEARGRAYKPRGAQVVGYESGDEYVLIVTFDRIE